MAGSRLYHHCTGGGAVGTTSLPPGLAAVLTGREGGGVRVGTKAPAWRRTARATVTGCGRERALAGRSLPTGMRPGGGWANECVSWA